MAKKYILEPTELEFYGVLGGGLGTTLANTPLYGLTVNELKNLIPDGVIVDISDGDKFIIASNDEGIVGTRDGILLDSLPEEYVSFGFDENLTAIISLRVVSKATTKAGTYTVSIYTETEDVYPIKNFTYEHAEVAKNDIEDIIQAIYTCLGETESQESYGYSPADRLVIAVAKLFHVDPEKALTTGNYPNQMKRIAAIIRGDFSNSDDGDGDGEELIPVAQ